MNEKMTFFSSYYTSIMKIKDPAERLKAFEAVCGYGIAEIEPEDMDDMPFASIIFDMAKPVIDSSLKSSRDGKKGGETPKEKHPSENKKSTLSKKEKAQKTYVLYALSITVYINGFKVTLYP